MAEDAALAFARREAVGMDLDFEPTGEPDDRFSIEEVGGRRRVRGSSGRCLLWAVHHLRDGGGDGTFVPRFSVRGVFPCEALGRQTPAQVKSLIDRMARWRMNRLIARWHYGYQEHADLVHRLCAERGIEISFYIETILAFCPDAEPRHFARNRDGSPRTQRLENETRLCASNDEALEMFRRGARRFFAAGRVPAGTRMVLIDADGYLFCECDRCRALSPVQRWMRFFSVAVEEASRAHAVRIEYPCYVWRYGLPADLGVFDGVAGVLYDTHQRFRWKTLGEDHALTHYNEIESRGDPAAAEVPLNRYLYERLLDWRRAFARPITVFENLMLQGSISCPQPYTPQLLGDLDRYEGAGIDGVIYEAFEPGIDSFADQLGSLSRAMWSDRPPYRPTALEALCAGLEEADSADFNFKNCFNVLAYLTTSRFDGPEALRTHLDDPLLHEYATRLRAYLRRRGATECRSVLDWLIDHPDRFDWMLATFNLVRSLDPADRPRHASELERRVLQYDKLWDVDERFATRLDEIGEAVRSVAGRVGAGGA